MLYNTLTATALTEKMNSSTIWKHVVLPSMGIERQFIPMLRHRYDYRGMKNCMWHIYSYWLIWNKLLIAPASCKLLQCCTTFSPWILLHCAKVGPGLLTQSLLCMDGTKKQTLAKGEWASPGKGLTWHGRMSRLKILKQWNNVDKCPWSEYWSPTPK